MAPKIPNYVMRKSDKDMIDLKSSRAMILFPALFDLLILKVFVFVQHVFRKSFFVSRYLEKNFLAAEPVTS